MPVFHVLWTSWPICTHFEFAYIALVLKLMKGTTHCCPGIWSCGIDQANNFKEASNEENFLFHWWYTTWGITTNFPTTLFQFLMLAYVLSFLSENERHRKMVNFVLLSLLQLSFNDLSIENSILPKMQTKPKIHQIRFL